MGQITEFKYTEKSARRSPSRTAVCRWKFEKRNFSAKFGVLLKVVKEDESEALKMKWN
jgi:hypothetical protein